MPHFAGREVALRSYMVAPLAHFRSVSHLGGLQMSYYLRTPVSSRCRPLIFTVYARRGAPPGLSLVRRVDSPTRRQQASVNECTVHCATASRKHQQERVRLVHPESPQRAGALDSRPDPSVVESSLVLLSSSQDTARLGRAPTSSRACNPRLCQGKSNNNALRRDHPLGPGTNPLPDPARVHSECCFPLVGLLMRLEAARGSTAQLGVRVAAARAVVRSSFMTR